MKVRTTTPDYVPLIYSFIQKKSEFDREIGAYSGVIQVTENKIHKTIFRGIPCNLFTDQPEFAIK